MVGTLEFLGPRGAANLYEHLGVILHPLFEILALFEPMEIGKKAPD